MNAAHVTSWDDIRATTATFTLTTEQAKLLQDAAPVLAYLGLRPTLTVMACEHCARYALLLAPNQPPSTCRWSRGCTGKVLVARPAPLATTEANS